MDIDLPTPDNPITRETLERLHELTKPGPVLIMTHESPDPDALASGKAIGTLLETAWGIPCQLVYSGLVARAENRAMLNLLATEWQAINQIRNLQDYSAAILVDTQPGAGNNRYPADHIPKIVIDHHHPLRNGLNKVPYVDVRPEVGSTVSMTYQYLESAEITPGPVLATAMFYGLQTDTLGLARGANRVDEVVYIKLLSYLDRSLLIQVEQAGLSRDYFRAFSAGLQAARVFDHSVIAVLEDMTRPDLAAEMADVLIRLETARAVLCLGVYQQTLHLSLRTVGTGEDAGHLVQRVVTPQGKAGGHGTMAGGQVPLNGLNFREVVDNIEQRFLEALNESGQGEALIPRSDRDQPDKTISASASRS
jgi:nanoRNase/pAp phosphatase (c-di-AMP/oligoRNAs hydrolase)